MVGNHLQKYDEHPQYLENNWFRLPPGQIREKGHGKAKMMVSKHGD